MINQDQLKELQQRIQSISTYLKIDQKRIELQESELKSQDPTFWDNPKKAEADMKQIRTLKFWINTYETLASASDDLEVLLDFFKEGEATENELDTAYAELKTNVEELELKNMLSGEEDQLSAVLQITSGAGGTESCDWASMLMRMYTMWAQKNNYKLTQLNYQDGDVAGAIETARPDTGIDLLMGIGGTPEGVITAAAMLCLGGSIQGKLHPKDNDEKERALAAGHDLSKVLTTRDLINSDDVFLSATGITDGELLRGIRYTTYGVISQSLVMRGKSQTVRLIQTEHHLK